MDGDLFFQLLIVAGGVVGLLLRSTRADVVLAMTMNVVIAAYIATMYAQVMF